MKKVSRAQLAKAFVRVENEHNRAALVRELASELVSSHRVSELALMVRDIDRELLAQKGHLEATVLSTQVLDGDLVAEVEGELMTRTGARTVHLQTKLDTALVGGIVAETPDEVIDLSLKYKLQQLEI